MRRKVYRFFVSFTALDERGNQVTGNATNLSTNKSVLSGSDIREIERMIKENEDYLHVIVTNYQFT